MRNGGQDRRSARSQPSLPEWIISNTPHVLSQRAFEGERCF